jgi:hypothetical protein
LKRVTKIVRVFLYLKYTPKWCSEKEERSVNNRKILCTFLIALLLTSLIVPEISARPIKRRGRKKGRKRKNTDPTINYIRAEGPGGRLDPAGTIGRGGKVRMYTNVIDAETASADLIVTIRYRPQRRKWITAAATYSAPDDIRYRPQRRKWITAAATYSAPDDYWYVDWVIPEGAVLGLYDVKVRVSDGDRGSAKAAERGEYEVIAEVNPDPELDEPEVILDADPIVNYIRAEGPTGRLDSGKNIATGNKVRMYTKVSESRQATKSVCTLRSAMLRRLPPA